jgi:ADP-ribose pyrophosphatase YjhB (NUDIX family)
VGSRENRRVLNDGTGGAYVETTSAGGVVVSRTGSILIVRQSGDTWSLPKGHAEKGEDLVETAKREIYEESGITNLSFVKELGSYRRLKEGHTRYGRPELKRIYIFLFTTDQEWLQPMDAANPEARWIQKECVADFLSYAEDREFFLGIINFI